MSWITPIKNTFIKFIVKGKNDSGSGGGIDEDALNAKLAQFYVTTETKILNLVNQQLSNYVLKTNFNALETKVTQLQEKVNNLPSGSGARLSYLTGTVYIVNIPTTLQNFDFLTTGDVSTLMLKNGTTIDVTSINKYIISYQHRFVNTASNINGYFVPLGMDFNNVGETSRLNYMNTLFLTQKAGTQTPNWTTYKPYFEISIILSDTLENITANAINKKQKATLLKINNENTLNVTSWDNIGGD